MRLDPEIRKFGTGVLRFLADGLEPTLDDLAWLMIIVSDNTATAMLLQTIGMPADVNKTMASLGYPTARLNETITLETALEGEPFATSSPRDLAEAYTQVDERGKAMLFRQQHLIGLPRKLPAMSQAVDVGDRHRASIPCLTRRPRPGTPPFFRCDRRGAVGRTRGSRHGRRSRCPPGESRHGP